MGEIFFSQTRSKPLSEFDSAVSHARNKARARPISAPGRFSSSRNIWRYTSSLARSLLLSRDLPCRTSPFRALITASLLERARSTGPHSQLQPAQSPSNADSSWREMALLDERAEGRAPARHPASNQGSQFCRSSLEHAVLPAEQRFDLRSHARYWRGRTDRNWMLVGRFGLLPRESARRW